MSETQLEELKQMIVVMGGHVEQALDDAVLALVERKPDRFQHVHEVEDLINQEHLKVDEACLQYMAKQGPKARDLRLIFSMIKINADLERMGDQCVNIAYTGQDYLQRHQEESIEQIVKMSHLSRQMVKGSLDAFVRNDEALAVDILKMDDEVDRLKKEVFEQNLNVMKQDPTRAEAALDLILIARNLERLGDHATNIAEDVIFVTTGKDIRHGGGPELG